MLKQINHKSGTQQAGLKRSRRHRSDHSMKRTYFPGITDIVVVTDPAEIRTISNDSRFDRDFIRHGPVRNVQRLRKMLRIFSLNGRLFPTILPRTNPSRAAARDELWSRLNVKADEVKRGPAQLEPLAEWVRGIGTAEKLGLLEQQSVGRLFVETFTATEESWAAALWCLRLHQPPLYARRKPPARSAVVPLEEARSSSLSWESSSKGAANRDLVFLSQSWSHCPAEKWVRALLERRVDACLSYVA